MDREGKSKKAKTTGVIVGIIVFVLAFYGVQQLFEKDLGPELKKAALEMNEKAPLKIDQITRLDSASTNGENNFVYHYTLTSMEESEVNLDTVNKYLRPGIIEKVKNEPGLKVFRDNKITMVYRYYDKNGDFVTEISVSPEFYEEE